MAGKIKYLWIFVFLLVMPMAFGLDDYFVVIEADNLIGNWDINGNTLYNLSNSKWLLTADTSDNYDIQRAKIMKTLFYGTDGTNPRANSTYIENISAIYTNELRDVGKRAYYIMAAVGGDYQYGDNIRTSFYDGTFNAGINENVGVWSNVYAYSSRYNPSGRGRLEMPDGTVLNDAYANGVSETVISYEIGTNTSADELDNPVDIEIYARGGYDQTANPDAYANGNIQTILLTSVAVSWILTNSGSYITNDLIDFYINHSIPEFLGDTFIINALDNYTKYGYNQTDITNFTATITNGTTTLNETANITDFVVFTNITGLWNITLSHPDYSNVTYENYNVSSDLTGYMYQTHEHTFTDTNNSLGTIVEDTYTDAINPTVSYYTTPYLYLQKNGYTRYKTYFAINLTNLNVSNYSSFDLNAYEYDQSSVTSISTSLCDYRNATLITHNSPPTNCEGGDPFSGSSWVISDGWEDEINDRLDSPIFIIQWLPVSTGSHYYFRSDEYGTPSYRPYITANYTSNFTIAVIDGFSENPLYNTTVNISNGDWSIQDYYNNTNTKTYGFDEGVYNITVTTKSGLTTQTELNYDLATSSNYFQLEMASSEYAIFNLTIYDETTEDIINENLTINAIGTQYSEERTITTGNWYDISENFKAEEYWFSAQGTAGTNGSDWDFRTYYINFMDVGTGLNTIYMYLLNDTLTEEICLNVYDNSGSALADTYIELLRHYPSNNSYKTVQIAKTDNNGYATLIVVPNTVVYKYLIKTSLSASASFTSNPAYLTDSSCYNIYLTTGSPVGVDWFNSQGVDYSYYYSESTASMNYLWDDSSNNVANACLKTYRMGVFKSLIEESCVSSAAGQISHTVDNTTEATYTSYMYVTMADDLSYEIFIGSFSHTIDLQIASTIGTLGLFLVILVIITIGMVGIWNGGVAVMLTGVAILLAQATGIILLNFVWTIGIIAVGGIIIYLNKD